MNTRMQTLCLWCGPAAMILFFIGFWGIAGLVPPPTPHDTPQEIKDLYVDNTNQIRVGLVITMVAGALTGPFAAAICTQMRRVEGTYSPLSYTELGMGMLGVLLFIFPTLVMQVCAFRPEDTDANLLRTMNDLAWIPFVGIFAPAVIQNIAIGICAFKDTDARVFPRWLGYFNFWAALAFLPAGLLYFFKTGAFAWNGLFVFWVPLTIFGAWFFVMFFVTRKAIQGQEAEEAAATGTATPKREAVPA
jgi:hypothetical protein